MAEQTPLSTSELGACARGRACRRASSTSSTATARRPARRSSPIPDVPKLTFTGSTAVGQGDPPRRPPSDIKSVHLELGGKTPEHRLRRRRPRPGDRRLAVHGLLQHRARSARAARACSSSATTRTTSSSSGSSSAPRRSGSATRPIRETQLGPLISARAVRARHRLHRGGQARRRAARARRRPPGPGGAPAATSSSRRSSST